MLLQSLLTTLALTNWVETNFPPGKYGPGFNVNFYELVFELLLRLRANYL